LLGLGMSIVVAPLTTTVMGAVEAQHSGVASGVNNAVSRVAGLVAIAVFGILLVHSFDARVQPALDRLELPKAARSSVDVELPKLAGVNLQAVEPAARRSVERVVSESFVGAFRIVMIAAALVALLAGAAGALTRKPGSTSSAR